MAKKQGMTVLVTGATGRQGGAAARHLREKGLSVRALTRDPNKDTARALVGRGTEVVKGDLNDKASVTRALDGVQGVYSVQSSSADQGVESEVRQGILLADEAKRSDVRHFVYSSVASADGNTGVPHFESKNRIEQHIRNTGMRHTILRPVFFMENLLAMRPQVEQGVLSYPIAPETRLQMVAVDDIGGMVAAAFDKPGHWQGRTVELAGDELSMSELAEAFTRMEGREVRYQQMPWDEFEKKIGADRTTMFRWFERTGYHVDIPGLRREYPALTSFERWLQAHWSKRMSA